MNPKQETLIAVYGTHWIQYVVPVCIWLLLSGAALFLFYLAGFTAHHNDWVSSISLLTGLVLLTGVHHWFFQKLFSENSVDIVLTDKRFIYLRSSLFFTDDIHEIALEKIRAVEALKHGLLQNVLRYGSIRFDAGGSALESSRVFTHIPHPHRLVRQINTVLEMR